MNNDCAQNTDKKNILIVDDTLENLKVLSQVLTKQGYEIRAVKNGIMALQAAQTIPPDLILLDIKMPDADGYEICRKLKEDSLTKDIPIIFLSALNEGIDKVKAFRAGGCDYISKPFQWEEVVIRVQNQLALQSAKAEIHKLNLELEQKLQQRTAHLVKKINELEHSRKLLHQTFYDRTTNLPNRTLFARHLEQAMERLQERDNYSFALLLIQCQEIGAVNNHLNKEIFKQVAVTVTRRLQSCLRQFDTISLFQDNEFVILLQDISDFDTADSLIRRLQVKLKEPCIVDNRNILLDSHFGVVLGTKEYDKPSQLLREVKTSMERNKQLAISPLQFNTSPSLVPQTAHV
jgi:diguanylate cyclase (GGDEF)-like protein